MGLKTERVNACGFDVGVFTNLSPEHLDDHGTMEDYKASKLKLFEMSDRFVINADDSVSRDILRLHPESDTIRFGIMNPDDCDLYADKLMYSNEGAKFDLVYRRRKEDDGLNMNVQGHIPALTRHSVSLSVPGQFAVYNILAAIGCCLQLGIELSRLVPLLGEKLDIPVPGRYDVLRSKDGVTAIVDYAHTASALENLLNAVRTNKSYEHIISVFGCGGNRDDTKRAPMGKISGEYADRTIITSDNPRGEDPLAIIRMIEEGIRPTGAVYEIEADRRKAIERAIRMAEPGDVVVIAGKGHESYQIFKDETIHFDDKEAVMEVFAGRG